MGCDGTFLGVPHSYNDCPRGHTCDPPGRKAGEPVKSIIPTTQANVVSREITQRLDRVIELLEKAVGVFEQLAEEINEMEDDC